MPGRSSVFSSSAGALAVAITLAAATPARAEWFITPFIGVKFAGATTFVSRGAGDTKVTLGGAVGVIGDGIFGLEAEAAYAPRFFEQSGVNDIVTRSYVFTAMGNVIVTLPREMTGYSLRPYTSGGGGLMRAGLDYIGDVLSVDSNLFGVNVGGGAIGALTPLTSVRFDLRYFKGISAAEDARDRIGRARLSFWRAAVGISIR